MRHISLGVNQSGPTGGAYFHIWDNGGTDVLLVTSRGSRESVQSRVLDLLGHKASVLPTPTTYHLISCSHLNFIKNGRQKDSESSEVHLYRTSVMPAVLPCGTHSLLYQVSLEPSLKFKRITGSMLFIWRL